MIHVLYNHVLKLQWASASDLIINSVGPYLMIIVH